MKFENEICFRDEIEMCAINEGFSPRDPHGPNFMPKTSTSIYSVTKGIPKIYQLKRE